MPSWEVTRVPGCLVAQCGDPPPTGGQGGVASTAHVSHGGRACTHTHPVNLQVVDATEVQLAVPTGVRYRETAPVSLGAEFW